MYKSAVSVTEAAEIMMRGRGTHFDPELLELFLGSMNSVVDIKLGFGEA